MCGRIAQSRSANDYVQAVGWDTAEGLAFSGPPAYNVPPGTTPLMLRRQPDGGHHVDRLFWGYRPQWAADKGMPLAINARLEKAASGRFFAPLWRTGRVIIPADGWYEWTGEPGHKQPWFIRLNSDEPMFLAALARLGPAGPEGKACGFAIVTEAAAQGMVDVHDRRPVVFRAQDAQLWMDPELPCEQAEALARNLSRPAEEFEWYPVSKRVNRAGNEGPDLIQPIELSNEVSAPGRGDDDTPDVNHRVASQRGPETGSLF